MKILPSLVAAISLLPIATAASSFSESMEKLSAGNPEFVAYADLREDFEAAGSLFTDAYLAYLMTGPDVPAIPLDFKRVFEHLGLSPLQSIAAVSEPRNGGGFVNQMLFEFSGPPKGLFVLAGDSNKPFTIGEVAPADADFVAEMNFNGVAVYQFIRSLVVDFMGPVGEDLIQAQMGNPVFPDGPTLAELISRLTTRVQLAAKPSLGEAEPIDPMRALLQGKAAMRIADVADLLEVFSPMLQQAGFVADEAGSLPRYTLKRLVQTQEIFVTLEGIPSSNDLLVSFNEGATEWFMDGGTQLADSEEFVTITKGLPRKGLSFWYSTAELAQLQIQQMDAQMQGNEKMLPLIVSLKSFMMNYTGTQSGVSFLEENAYRVISHQPASYKTNIAIAGAILPLSFASSFAAIAEAQSTPEPDASEPSPAE